jgi:hypothetical protein
MRETCKNHKYKSTVTLITILVIGLASHTNGLEPPRCCEGDNIFDNDECTVKNIDNRTTSEEILLHCNGGRFLIDPVLDPEEEFQMNAKNGDLELNAIDITYTRDL